MKNIILTKTNCYILGMKGASIEEISKTICEAYNDNKPLGIEMFERENVIAAHSNYLTKLLTLKSEK